MPICVHKRYISGAYYIKKKDKKCVWIFRSFWVLLKLNVGVFNFISTTAGIGNLIYFIFPIRTCSVFSAQPYLLLQQTWWKTLWRTPSIFIVTDDRISVRLFFSAGPELAQILPSCVTSSKLKFWDDQHCHSRDRWNDTILILNRFNCTVAKYKVIIEEGFFWHANHYFSPSAILSQLAVKHALPIKAACPY